MRNLRESKRKADYRPAAGSEAVVCWIMIAACLVIGILSFSAWLVGAAGGFPFLETLLPVLVIVGCVVRLKGWAPPPKGVSGGGGGGL